MWTKEAVSGLSMIQSMWTPWIATTALTQKNITIEKLRKEKERMVEVITAAKQLHHEIRLLDMIRHFKQVDYSELLNPFKGEDKSRQNHYDYIRKIKNRDISLTEQETVRMGAEIQKEADAWLDIYKEKNILDFNANTLAEMDQQKFLIIKKALHDELLREG